MKKIETGRKPHQTKKRPLASVHETTKVVSDDTRNTLSSKKKRASTGDYSGHSGANSPAMDRAEEIQSKLAAEFPSMIKLMLPSHVTGGFWLGLPKRFCNLHMPSEDTEFILEDESGEEYKTRYLSEKIGFSGGWRGFSVVHNLIEGDVVLFHLVKPTKFKVYIVRSGSEVLEPIRFPKSIVDFKEVNSLENFTVSVHGLNIDSVFSKHVRTKYYELCHSQKSFLHNNLLEGLNRNLVAGIISQTVNIADAIKACKVSTSQEHFSIWDKTLKAFEDMGMIVGFLRAKLEKLVGIGSESKICWEACQERIVEANEEMKILQDKLLQIREAAKRLDSEIENLTVTAERHAVMFQQEADAPW